MITVRRQLELETIFLITITAVASLFFLAYRNNNSQSNFNIVSGIPSMSVPAEAVSPEITVSSQISPDGTRKVTMRVTENNNGTKIYEFLTADENNSGEKLIFTKTLDSLSSMSVPFNSWSPDNKYFFVRQNIGGSKGVLVFSGLGTPLTATESYFEAVEAFNQKNTGNNFDEATGWASETLIIMNTKKPDGTKGFSYWFEIPSKAIIQLSTEF